MKRFPAEFEALLSAKGRRLLKGRDSAWGALSRAPFFSSTELLERKALPHCTRLLAKAFTDLLVEQTTALPAANSAPFSHYDRLPKVGRQLTVPMAESTETVAFARAQECGLAEMMFSGSYRAFCEALAGQALEGPATAQVLCYRPHDYVGPHTDHHPENPKARHGYVDVHFSFCTPGVQEQFLVYEKDGHLTEQRSIAASGTLTAYRLPVWHYVTPLQTKRATDRRWLVLGTFFHPPPGS